MTGLIPDITAVTVVEHGVLRLAFSDGLSADINVLDRMRGPVFADAVTPTGFAKVFVDPVTGTVVWPGGADLAPDTLYGARGLGLGQTRTWRPNAQPQGTSRRLRRDLRDRLGDASIAPLVDASRPVRHACDRQVRPSYRTTSSEMLAAGKLPPGG